MNLLNKKITLIATFLLLICSRMSKSVNIESVSKNSEELLNLYLCCQENEFFNTTSYRCESLLNNANISWDLSVKLLNGTVVHGNILKDFKYEITKLQCNKSEIYYWHSENDSIDIDLLNNKIRCFTPYYFNDTNKYRFVPLDCFWDKTFPLFLKYDSAYIVSILFLTLTLLIYVSIRELRTKLAGKILIFYLVSMIFSKILVTAVHIMLESSIDFQYPIYVFMCFLHYYIFMSIFLWLNILGYDAWIILKKTNIEFDSNKYQRRIYFYSCYVWTIASVPTVIALWRKYSAIIFHCKRLSHVESCLTVFYAELKAISLIMFIMIFVILILNIVIFTHLSIMIYKIRYDVAVMTQRQLFLKNNATLLLRLSIVMGIPWTLIILLHFIKYSSFLFKLIYVSNFVQSFFIFIVLIVKENVLNILRRRSCCFNITEV